MKNTKLFIHTHLGLGDHIMCCGLVRHTIALAKYGHYYIGCKDSSVRNLTPFFSDLQNTSLHSAANDKALYEKLPKDCDILKIGFNCLDPRKRIDESFYAQAGFPLEYKWSKFHVNRCEETASRCVTEHAPDGDYLFVHDACSKAQYTLKIGSDLPVVRPTDMKYTLVDYPSLIEKAKEVHVLNSSFMNLIDLACDRGGLFFHNINSTHVPMSDYDSGHPLRISKTYMVDFLKKFSTVYSVCSPVLSDKWTHIKY